MKLTGLIAFLATVLLTPATLAAAIPTGDMSTTSTFSNTTLANFTSASLRSLSKRGDFTGHKRCNKKKGHYCRKDFLVELDDHTHFLPPCRAVSVIWAHWDAPHEHWWYDRFTNFDNFGGLFADEIAFVTGFEDIGVQGVIYDSQFTRNIQSIDHLMDDNPMIDEGSVNIEMVLNRTAHFCPKTKFVLAGEFAGTRMVRDALKRTGSVAASDMVKASKYLRCPHPLKLLLMFRLVVLYNDPQKDVLLVPEQLKKSINVCDYRHRK